MYIKLYGVEISGQGRKQTSFSLPSESISPFRLLHSQPIQLKLRINIYQKEIIKYINVIYFTL